MPRGQTPTLTTGSQVPIPIPIAHTFLRCMSSTSSSNLTKQMHSPNLSITRTCPRVWPSPTCLSSIYIPCDCNNSNAWIHVGEKTEPVQVHAAAKVSMAWKNKLIPCLAATLDKIFKKLSQISFYYNLENNKIKKNKFNNHNYWEIFFFNQFF